MIAVDTSTLVAFLEGEAGEDVELLDRALASNMARLPPVVVTEVLSAPRASGQVVTLVERLPRLAIVDGYWERAGSTRRKLGGRRIKAPLADALICQSCLDFDLPLLTRDPDFKPFADHCGLQLAVPPP